VISQDGNHCQIQDLNSDKITRKHISGLRPYDTGGRSETELQTIAARDLNAALVEEILNHDGYDPEKPNITGKLKFKVKWVGLTHEQTSWEPYKSLRLNEKLHTYLVERELSHLIPTEIRKNFKIPPRKVKPTATESETISGPAVDAHTPNVGEEEVVEKPKAKRASRRSRKNPQSRKR
jgi:hypothetical protein